MKEGRGITYKARKINVALTDFITLLRAKELQ